MKAGFRDTKGNYVAGTEIMHLVPYKGRLYAANSLWMEREPTVPKACQVLVLDSPEGSWRVEHQFTQNNLRLASLKTITFSTDGKGNRIGAVSMLLAAPDIGRGPVQIFSRDDETGQWVPTLVGSVTQYTTTRSIGFHRDRVTEIDRVFAGTDSLGVVGGVYAPSVPGRIRWDTSPEFKPPQGERVMGFCECNGMLFCATTRRIYKRTDGSPASWQQIYFCPEKYQVGIRGLTAVSHPSGSGEMLLFGALNQVRWIDPMDGFKETIELDMPSFLTQRLGIKILDVLAAYNEFMPYTVPGTGELVWLFGFQCMYPPSVVETKPPPNLRLLVREGYRWYFAAEARYFIRRAKGRNVSYEVAEIADPSKPTLVSVRTIAVSPFLKDHGQAFYFGGFDCNFISSHNTAWIYRAELYSK
jgi:poly(A) polymerase